jgi:transposase
VVVGVVENIPAGVAQDVRDFFSKANVASGVGPRRRNSATSSSKAAVWPARRWGKVSRSGSVTSGMRASILWIGSGIVVGGRSNAMKPPLFVRPLSAVERRELEAGLRSHDVFTLRRSQILLASARGHRPSEIAPFVGCSVGTVRNAIRAFLREALGSLEAKGTGPKNPQRAWPRDRDDELRELLHQSPRAFGKPRSLWTLELIAEVCFEREMTGRKLSAQAFSSILARMGINWKRAKDWMTSPDPAYAAKKARRDRLLRLSANHPEWAIGFEDEVWWSRITQPKVRAWTDGPPLKVQVLKSEDDDPDPDAIACYGFYRYDTGKVTVRFVEGRPVGDVTIQFLEWLCWGVAREGKKVLVVIWDNPSWHAAEGVAGWLDGQNRRARRGEGVRVDVCDLPVASPWLNNIEPCWTHAKKAVMEPGRKLTAAEITARTCEHFGCELLPYLKAASPAAGGNTNAPSRSKR